MGWDAHILAGGLGRRLGGRDKSALVIDGRRILDHQVSVLLGLGARVVIVGGAPDRPAGSGVTVLEDRLPGLGALGGLYTALAAAESRRTLVLACDLPFVTAAFLDHLARTGTDCDVTLPRNAAGLQPLCAVYARSAAAVLRRAIDQGVRRIGDAIAPLRQHVVEGAELAAFDAHERLLHNINTPDDYERALALVG